VIAYCPPSSARYLNQGNVPTGQALLVADVAITGDQDGKASLFCSAYQVAVGHLAPAHAAGVDDFITGQSAPKPLRSVLVE